MLHLKINARYLLLLPLIFGLMAGADVAQVKKDDPNAALLAAARAGDAAQVRAALDAKADVNTKHSSGKTPLMLAAESGHQEIVRILLSRYADPNRKDSSGKTALFLATEAASEYAEVVQLLLSKGAAPNIES